jgi:hypothetical protein
MAIEGMAMQAIPIITGTAVEQPHFVLMGENHSLDQECLRQELKTGSSRRANDASGPFKQISFVDVLHSTNERSIFGRRR